MFDLTVKRQFAEKPTLYSPDTKNQENNALGGTLASIPLELREAIYRLLFQEDHLSILRVSRYINAEATAVLHKTRPCRMYVGYPRFGRPNNSGRRPAASCFPIQNFEVRVNFSNVICHDEGHYYLVPPHEFKPISVFGDPNVCRQSMVLSLDPNLPRSALLVRKYLKMLFEESRHVLGFRSLLILFLSGGVDENLRKKWIDVQGIATDLLDPKLGPSVCFDTERGLCVAYKPWDFVSRQCRVKQEYWHGIQYTRFTYEGDGNEEPSARKADALRD
ncbi:hypothetical protein BDR22DRAFT_888902 [Usnea florida]